MFPVVCSQVIPSLLSLGDWFKGHEERASELDRYVDLPPYRQKKHLRLELSNFAAISIGPIIRKKS
jgi:hypothetical protein